MKLYVKMLRGDVCHVDVDEQMSILEVKELIEQKLRVSVGQQTLVHLGKTLLDEKTIASYEKIKEGDKLHLVIRKPEPLVIVLARLLGKYYDEEQTKTILDAFMADFHSSVQTLSLDDIENIAIAYLNEDACH